MQTETTGISPFTKFLNHGGAGILAVLLIFLVFILCVTWLKSMAVGILLAFLCLPLEKFFERIFFRGREKSDSAKQTPEQMRKKRMFRIRCASTAVLVTVLLAVALFLMVVFSLLIPWTKSAGNSVIEWGRNNMSVQGLEKQIAQFADSPEGQEAVKSAKEKLLQLAREKQEMLAAFAIDSSASLISTVLIIIRKLGTVLIDILLALFFFVYFLQKMALFDSKESRRSAQVMSWGVSTIYNSPWLPKVSEETKQNAVRILSHIGSMLGRWARGYFIIISIEAVLYSIAFTIAGVPYPLLAGIIAGMTILLPVIGLIGSITLTVGLCLIFSQGSLVVTLSAAFAAYAVICLLEQGIMVPHFVGGAMNMTLVETIIVVLLGGMFFGIPGMILALPTAAVIKYLVPEIYHAAQSQEE